MKLRVNTDGKIRISEYYFQTLCMIFWPGAKFGAKADALDAESDADSPGVSFDIRADADGVVARATISDRTRLSSMERRVDFDGGNTPEMTAKLAAGSAMLAAGVPPLI